VTTERPAPPRRPFALVLPLLVAATGFALGGFTALWLQGVLWGVIAGASLVLAFRLAKLDLDVIGQVSLLIGVVVSCVVSTLVLPDVPERAVSSLALRVGAAWVPAGMAAAFTVHRSGAAPTKSLNTAIGWAVAGLLGLTGALTFGALVPISWLGPVDEPSYGAGIFAFMRHTRSSSRHLPAPRSDSRSWD
jgi:hypothetical protein